MLFKYIKANIKNLFSLIIVFSSIFIGCTTYIMKTDNNIYLDYMKNIEIGETYFVSATEYSADFCKFTFDVDPIPTLIIENIQNNGVISYPFINTPLLFVENDELLEDEVILDFETYTYNNYPSYANVNGLGKITISSSIFSNKRGAYISNKALKNNIIRYYGITVTENNKKAICSFVNKKSRDEYKGTNYIYDYYGKNISSTKYNSTNIQKASFYTLYTISLLSITVFLNYAKKNKNDLVLFHIYGTNKITLFSITISVPLISSFCSFLLSIPICYLYEFCFNTIASPTISCISFGLNSWKMIILSFIFLITISIIESIILDFLITKRIIKE